MYCTELKSVKMDNGVKYISESAFSNCKNLTELTLPNSVIEIDDYAFYNCSAITNFIIPNSVTSIGESAFMNCSGLTNFEIPNTITSISSYMLCGCSNLTRVEIPNSVTSIGNSAFSGCSNLTRVEIPNSVTSIGDSAFSGCSSLKRVVIPNGITKIGTSAFYNCSAMKTIINLSSLTIAKGSKDNGYVGYYADKIISIPNGFIEGDFVFKVIDEINQLVAYVGTEADILLPENYKDNTYIIGDYAFSNCTGLTSIVISNCVTSIGNYAFLNCTGLINIEIPNSVTSIESGAFRDCVGLKSLTIPNSVTSIGFCAFYGCTGLNSIEIPNRANIGDYAFAYCSGLINVTSQIPAEDLYAISTSVFAGVNAYICTLYVPYGAKETYATTQGWKEFANIVELAPAELTITINEYGCATYCSEYALDFSNVEGLKAYSAIGYKPSTQTVTLARVMTTGAGQGIFIKGEPGEYTVPVIDNFDEYTLNLLVGTLEQTTVNSTDGKMSNYKFTITDGDAAPMFYPFEDNTTFSANRAYLQIPTAWLPATAQKSLNVRFDDGETTDIEELKGEPTVDASQSGEVKTVYDLQGRVVENPAGGIYIVNGKKVIIK